jgi:hypothetical protein
MGRAESNLNFLNQIILRNIFLPSTFVAYARKLYTNFIFAIIRSIEKQCVGKMEFLNVKVNGTCGSFFVLKR